MNPFKHILVTAFFLGLAGCTSTGMISNTPIQHPLPTNPQQITTGARGKRSDDAFFYVGMSGGGTRAAAFSYGVLRELRDTTYTVHGKEHRLLDEIDYISSVSGGSFTAAYYSLYGDRIFEDYEKVFLRQNVQKSLVGSIFNPFNWLRSIFTGFNRTEYAIDYYDRMIFNGSTFSDIFERDGPYLAINSTDLGIGARFAFTQEQFNLLCSDIGTYKVARAVAASSAVPVAFTPVTLKNYNTCKDNRPSWLNPDQEYVEGNPRLESLINAYESYLDKKNRPYIHLVDGGITDNLGIRSLYDSVEMKGGSVNAAKASNHRPKYIIMIIINAATRPENPMDSVSEAPSSMQVVSAVSDTQINRYTLESLSLLEQAFNEWATELSTPGQPVIPFLIKLDFESIGDTKQRLFFNNMATSFSLPNNEVDELIDAGQELLRQSSEFQALLETIRKATLLN